MIPRTPRYRPAVVDGAPRRPHSAAPTLMYLRYISRSRTPDTSYSEVLPLSVRPPPRSPTP